MSRTVLVAGMASHVVKSTIDAGRPRPAEPAAAADSYEGAADLVADHVDLGRLSLPGVVA